MPSLSSSSVEIGSRSGFWGNEYNRTKQTKQMEKIHTMHLNPSHRPPRPRPWIGLVISISIFAFLIVCVKPPSDDEVGSSNSERVSSSITPKNALLEGYVHVQCEIITPFDDKSNTQAAHGKIDITVHTGLAPLVSNAFLELVSSKHFDHNYIFRAVDGFIVQWGIESPTAIRNSNKERKKFPKVDIDPQPSNADDNGNNNNILRSNVRGTLNFAGGNSATGQVYVNRGTNLHLDNEPGSLPFATLDERSMKIIDSIYSYKEGIGQVKALKNGNDEVKRLFPRMSRIEKCWIQR
jgi:cyclophilin family peptidyl-prolyl cis-trans isomerase